MQYTATVGRPVSQFPRCRCSTPFGPQPACVELIRSNLAFTQDTIFGMIAEMSRLERHRHLEVSFIK